MKIAIVDDQVLVCNSFAEIVKIQNHVPDCYYSAEQFLESKKVKEYECMLVDLRLPDMNGVELVSHLRKQQIVIPTILISGNMDQSLVETLEDQRYVATLRKPCGARDILDKLQEFIGVAENS